MEADKLKFTKITSDSLYHFKYDGVDYVLFNGDNEEGDRCVILYLGRCKSKIVRLCYIWARVDWLLRYKHNKLTLSGIDKEYFIEHLPKEVKDLLDYYTYIRELTTVGYCASEVAFYLRNRFGIEQPEALALIADYANDQKEFIKINNLIK